MVAMVNLFESGVKLPLKMPGNTLSEDLRDLLRGQFKETQFTRTFEEFVDRKGIAKDKVQAIFHLAEGIEAAQIHGLTFSFGELGAQNKGPILETLLQQFGGKTVGSPLEGFGVINGQKGIILFSESDASSVQFGFQKGVTVDKVSGLKRKKRGDSQDHGTQLGISEVEVVMGKAAAGLAEEGIIRIFRGKLGSVATKGGALLHTLIDEVDAIAVLTFHTLEPRSHLIFFTDFLFRPLEGNVMIEGVGLYPGLIVFGSLPQDFLGNTRNTNHLTEKIDDVFRS